MLCTKEGLIDNFLQKLLVFSSCHVASCMYLLISGITVVTSLSAAVLKVLLKLLFPEHWDFILEACFLVSKFSTSLLVASMKVFALQQLLSDFQVLHLVLCFFCWLLGCYYNLLVMQRVFWFWFCYWFFKIVYDIILAISF